MKRSPTGRIEHTQPFAFGAETTDVGENLYTCVSDDYKQGDNRFTGKIHKVTVQVGKVQPQRGGAEGYRRIAYEESAVSSNRVSFGSLNTYVAPTVTSALGETSCS